MFRTRLGEITIWVDKVTLLCKAVCSLPEKFHGLTDIEKRYRQRYVDLIVNEETRQTFRNRSRIVSLIRRYLDDHGFLEFETPILQPVYGGANARPFTSYHNFLDQKLFLRIAPELYLKRLVVGGFEKVFEIARNFRNEAVDTDHNPEFSMVEIYWAYKDFQDMIALTEDIVASIVFEVHGKFEIPFGETTLNFDRPWKKLSMVDAVKEYANIDVFSHSIDDLQNIALTQGMNILTISNTNLTENKYVAEVAKLKSQREFLIFFFENFVEEKLIQPTFIFDYPVENSPLAKRHRTKEGFTERFELFIHGMEVGNGFSELNNPVDQMARFEAQDEKRRLGDLEAQMIDYDFINALGYGMPPTGGVGIGIDRLVMLLTNNNSIKEVILFPSMKKLGAITIVASGTQSYKIGDKIKLSGTSTVGREIFLTIKAQNTNKDSRILNELSIMPKIDNHDTFVKVDVESDNTWSYLWDTSKIASTLGEGTFTIFAIESPSVPDNLAGVVHGTVSIILKR